jgi:hypothetical protein
MASDSVRAKVREAWLANLRSLRYIDTINRSMPYNPPLPLPDTWGTLAFDTTQRRPVTMGKNPWYEEQGVATFIICARSGHGDNAAISVGSQVMRIFQDWRSGDGSIWFESVGAPKPIELETEGDWFLVGVAANYKAQERTAATP